MNKHFVTLALALIGAALLAGCPASMNWTTARTLPRGTVQHTIGVEEIGIIVDHDTRAGCTVTATDACTYSGVGFLGIPFPAYQVRFGLADWGDLGLKVSATGLMSTDFKIQFLRSDALDLAVDPGIAWGYFVTYLQLPFLASLNLGQMATLTLGPRVTYMLTTASIDTDSYYADGLLVGGMINFQIRPTPTFAITPGVDLQRLIRVNGTSGDSGFWFVSFGIGFSFGGGADYGLGTQNQPPPPPMPVQPQPQPQPQPVYGAPPPPVGAGVQIQVAPGAPPTPPPGY